MPNVNNDYVSISLNSISADSVCSFDLHLKNAGTIQLFRERSIPISQKDLDDLVANGQEALYVPAEQQDELYDYRVNHMPQLLQDDSVPIHAKLQVLNETSVHILGKFLDDPTSRECIKKAVDNCENHVGLALQGESVREPLLNNHPDTSFPIAHAIKVSNLSVLLGLRCGIDGAEKLHGLGVGALLHEIGKRLIDKDYYLRTNKRIHISNTRLKRYPVVGREMLEKSGVVPEDALRPVLQHQERLDGSGFPFMLKDTDICLEARIVAICDHYDETLHLYSGRKALTPFQVLNGMTRTFGKFDKDILVEFIRLLGADSYRKPALLS